MAFMEDFLRLEYCSRLFPCITLFNSLSTRDQGSQKSVSTTVERVTSERARPGSLPGGPSWPWTPKTRAGAEDRAL
jgi:hypothetical protein